VLVLAALAAAQIGLILLWSRSDRDRERSLLPVRAERRSDPAPDLVVERPGGEREAVPARSGRWQLVHFWATWCPPCRMELPTLFDMAKRNRARLTVWAITTDTEWSKVRRFLNGEVSPLVVRDPDGTGARAYGVGDLPDSYLIDPEGKVRARFPGAQNWSGREMRAILDSLGVEPGR
jgi:thiol-disulfide isomerase/thioredoxin